MRRTARSWAIVAVRLAVRDSSPARSAARRRTSSAWAWRVLPLILTSLWASCARSVADTALNGRGTVGLGHVPQSILATLSEPATYVDAEPAPDRPSRHHRHGRLQRWPRVPSRASYCRATPTGKIAIVVVPS